MKKTLIIISFLFCKTLISQEVINVEDILVDLKSKKTESCFYNDMDYYGILYLDDSSIVLLNEIKPKYNILPISDGEYFFGKKYPIEKGINTITDLFNSKHFLDNLMSKFIKEDNYKITHLYYKDKYDGFISISSDDKSEYY